LADPSSLYHHYRHLLQWRRSQPALIHGEMALLPQDEQVFAFVREHAGQRVLCAFNLSDKPALLSLPTHLGTATALPDSGCNGTTVAGGSVSFAPWGVLLARLA
jgi:alpha-glucosidase